MIDSIYCLKLEFLLNYHLTGDGLKKSLSKQLSLPKDCDIHLYIKNHMKKLYIQSDTELKNVIQNDGHIYVKIVHVIAGFESFILK